MKKLLVAAAVGFVAIGAVAQGAFTFGNKNLLTTPPIDAKVFADAGMTTALAGTAYWAQAYIKLAADPDTSYAPAGTAVNFRTGNNAGYIAPQVITTKLAGGTDINVQLRAWDAAGGASYEAAESALKAVGKSEGVLLKLTEAPNPPADMIGLKSFYVEIIPEPSTLALGALGAAALFLRRRS